MHTISRTRIAFILAVLSAVGPFSIDTYLPALPEIASSLHVPMKVAQQTLTAYLTAFALMVLWHGALSDAWGRRRIILVSLIIFALASFGCVFATRIEHLWILRAVQGISAGAGIVVSRAIVRDLYDGVDAQRLMARVAIMFAIAPTIAPIIGGWLHTWFGWRSIFVFLTLWGILLALLCFYCLPETLPPEKRQTLKPRVLIKSYLSILTHKKFLAASFAISLCFAGFFVYVLSAPVFLIKLLGVSERAFLWLFGPAMFGMIAGSTLTSRLAGKKPVHSIIKLGLSVMAFAAVLNLCICIFIAPAVPWNIVPFVFYNCGMALVMPGLTLIALDHFPQRRGTASSCQSFIQLAVSSLLAGFVAPVVWHSTLSLSLTMVTTLTLSFIIALPYLIQARKT